MGGMFDQMYFDYILYNNYIIQFYMIIIYRYV